ncbi:uncharacterized protein [Parasteatoda tepidariorum]|uniref:uncharacterized protein n=1 Tax=Parasteatoda tepidariorum TaxID=114398 RepID=UPI00077FE1E5|nr:uncharacterized protein LOC107440192 [Parasteatoda tepidariorum]
MDRLKTKRTPLRSAFTKTFNSLTEEVEKETVDLQSILILSEQLEEKFNRLKADDMEILEFLLENKASEEEYTKEFDSCEAHTDKFVALKTKVNNITASINVSISPTSNERNMELQQPSMAATTFKLPKLNLIEFDGDPRNWLNFWNTFKKIHKDTNIDKHSKFVYLIQATTPKLKAREIVQSFPTTEENYPKVIQHLKNRFGREDILIQLYVRDLLNIVLSNASGNKNFKLSFLYDNPESKL